VLGAWLRDDVSRWEDQLSAASVVEETLFWVSQPMSKAIPKLKYHFMMRNLYTVCNKYAPTAIVGLIIQVGVVPNAFQLFE